MLTLGDEFSGKLERNRRRGRANKSKGNRNELALAKALTEWAGVKFIRVPASGGYRAVNHHYFIGDVIKAEGDPFPFVIETKHLQKIHIYENLRGSQVFTIWDQVLNDSIRANRLPCLFLRQDGMKANTWFFVAESRVIRHIQKAYPALKIEAATGDNGEVELSVANTAILFKVPYPKLLELIPTIPPAVRLPVKYAFDLE